MKTKILRVDDEADLDALFKQLFRRPIHSGQYEFSFVSSGQQALNLIAQQPDVNLMLSAIQMPGMDGLTLLASKKRSALCINSAKRPNSKPWTR